MRFERVFRQYGLPEVIRTDNGTPFASRGLGGLSRLSYWWIRLGIYPERIEPDHPEQNGRHERMHKTLKDHTAKPPAKNIVAQQKCFNDFCVIFTMKKVICYYQNDVKILNSNHFGVKKSWFFRVHF